jgi:enolase-phosphatase E1
MKPPIRHILLDIEGTTCPVSFVSEVLFPYAAREVSHYLTQHALESDIQTLLGELQRSWSQEEDPEALALLQNSVLDEKREQRQPEGGPRLDPAEQVATLLPYIQWLIQRDRKVTAWKDLQGRIWREGYACGALKAALFPEVAQTLRHWKGMGVELSVYSSGSVAAQELLYGHSEDGDLRSLFSHWFDTRIGAKQEARSYEAILEVLGCVAGEVLFISDSSSELSAACSAGLQVIFSDREGNPQRDSNGFARIQSLAQVSIELASHQAP